MNKKQVPPFMIMWLYVVISLITIKMMLEMKNRSHRYDINRSRSRHRNKYTKY